MPARDPGQLEVRDIDAGEQENKHSGTHQDQYKLASSSRRILRQTHDPDAVAAVSIRELLREAARYGLQIGRSMGSGGLLLEPSQHPQIVVCAILARGRTQIERSPNLGAGGKVDVGTGHPDDREPVAVQQQVLSDNTRIAAQMSLPEAVTDDDDWSGSMLKIDGTDLPP